MHPGASAPQTLSVPLLNSASYDSPDLGEYMAATIPIYGDAQIKGVADANAGRLMGVVTTMPSAGSCKGCAVLYEGAEGTYSKHTIYASDGTAWTAVGKVVTVDSSVTAGSSNPVTGGAVASRLENYQTKISGAASTIDTEDLAASCALVSNANGKVAVSPVTSTELGYLGGVKSNVQTQLDGKQAKGDYATATALSDGLEGKLDKTAKAKSAETADSATQATKATQDGSGNVISDTYLAKTDAASTYLKKADADFTKAISAEGVAVSWTADASVSGYSYKGTIALQGVTSEYMPFVTFSATQASSGNFCPVAESGTNAIYIWSKTNDAVTVPSVAAAKM